jgi:hypothetical protein
VVQIAGSLSIRISRVLTVGVRKRGDLGKTEDLEEIRDLGKIGDPEGTGDPEKTGGNLFQEAKQSTFDASP